jgi:predicted alpha/beta-hydrolase family hydrolase
MIRVEPFENGFLHYPANAPSAGLALTHGAGSDCSAKLLVAVADAFATAGIATYRYNLPFRLRRHGPPSPATAPADQEGVREAVRQLRALVPGRVLAGGVSYGGRQTTIAAASTPNLADGLLLLSYPLHAPGKPTQLRTAHFPDLRTRALFVQGDKDPFGSPAEMQAAIPLIPAATEFLLVPGAGHDLGRKHAELAAKIVEHALAFLLI